jgi:hypothetical protein
MQMIPTVGRNHARTCYAEPVTFPADLRRTARRPLLLSALQGSGARTYGLSPRSPCGPPSTKSTSRCFGCTPRLVKKQRLFAQLHSGFRVQFGSPTVPALIPGPRHSLPSQTLLFLRGWVADSRHRWPQHQASFARLLPPRLHSYLIAPGGRSLPNATSCCFVLPPSPRDGGCSPRPEPRKKLLCPSRRSFTLPASQILPCQRGSGVGCSPPPSRFSLPCVPLTGQPWRGR